MRRLLVFVVVLIALATADLPAAAPQQFEALVGLARVNRDAGNMAAARDYLERARQLQPFDETLRTEFFWVLADTAPGEAVVLARELLTSRPGDQQLRERAIAAAVASANEAAAMAFAQAGVAQTPSGVLWHRRVAESLMRQGRAEEAIAAWEAVVQRTDATAADRAGLALALEAAGQHARAMSAWGDVAAADLQRDPAWQDSRLRAIVRSAPPAVAAAEVEAWLRANPDDVSMRETAVDLWRRAGRVDLARETLQPLLARPDGARWWRRDVELAREAGDAAAVVARLDRMAASGTRADRLALADALVDAGAVDRAATLLRDLARATDTCDEAVLASMDRVAGEPGTTLLVETLRRPGCDIGSSWVERGVARATADGRHADAIALIERLPSARSTTPDLQRLAGQLRLWTGDFRGAVTRLTPLVAGRPDDLAAREALIDAHRGLGDAYEAWRVAGPLTTARETSAARLLTLAELAIEADQPAAVESLLARVPANETTADDRRMLLGRALAALGRPADAAALLAAVPDASLSATARLALIDSVYALRGVNAALDIARRAPASGAAIAGADRDLVARRLMLETLAGHTAATQLRAQLAAVDTAAPVFVDVEVALAEGRPMDALAALETLPPAGDRGRADDLRATALAGTGDLKSAADLLAQQRGRRPDFVPFIVRETELAWRLTPDEDTLAAVLALPSRFDGHRQAVTIAARALVELRRHEDVIALLDPRTPHERLTMDERVLMAQSLRALARPAEALEFIDEVDLIGPSAILRAEIVAQVRGEEAGRRAFEALAARRDVSPDVYRAWAAATTEPDARRRVLDAGVQRYPEHAGLLVALSVVTSALGDRAASLDAATRAVEIEPSAGEAWYQLMANTRAVRPDALEGVLARFAPVATSRPSLAIATADRVAALVRSASDPVLVAALEWLRVPADGDLQVSRDLARVRLYAAAERWGDALEAVDAAVAQHPDVAAVQRLRADVLSWAGRHDESIEAYDAYLALVPSDVEARRQQARVAGWAGRFSDAERLYAALRAGYPDDRVLAAEAEAKRAYFRGRWREAVTRYQRWLDLDPANSEARFELSESLRAAGELERAEAALSTLAPEGGHRLADAARDRERWRREPTVTALADLRSAKGYEGQRLVDIRSTGGRFTSTRGADGRMTFAADAMSVHVGASGVTRRGYEVGASATHRLARATFDARVSIWDVSGPGRASAQAVVAAQWAPVDRWAVHAGATRELLVENLATVDDRLAASGPFAAVSFEAPHMSLDLRSSWQRLSDGNTRARVSLSASRVLSERLDHVRAVVWADVVDFAERRSTYFTPRGFVRVDAGVEYAHRFSQPRFRGDRMDTLAVGYLVGTDSRGTLYQHPSLRLAWEVSSSVALSVRGDLVHSRAYKERAALVSVHLIGGAFSR